MIKEKISADQMNPMIYNLSILKQVVRYYAGLVLKMSYFLPLSKKLYFFILKKFLMKLNLSAIKGTWVRRSLTGRDFTPLWSDIDITLVVNEDLIGLIRLPKNLLVKDIQIVSDQHLNSWLTSGGFRNRQIPNWIKMQGSIDLLSPPALTNEFIAFELAQEIYVLYQQLENKLKQTEFLQWQYESTYKLIAEMERLLRYWQERDDRLLFLSREDVFPRQQFMPAQIGEYLERFDQNWQSIFKELALPLQGFPFKQYLNRETEEYQILNFSIQDRQVLVAKEINRIPFLKTVFPEKFVCSETFVCLVKGVGVQEQTLLNTIAHDKNYYYQFNLQRLANDLVSAALAPTDQSRLYYCFKNINEFHLVLFNESVPGWDDIELVWQNEGIVNQSSQELTLITSRFLEVLRTLR